MRRGPLAVMAALVLLGPACNSSDDEKPVAAPTTTRGSAVAPTTLLTCDGIGPAPAAAEITYLQAGRVEAVAADGTGRRCLVADAPTPAQAPLAWGGLADRLLIPPTSVFLADGRHSADVGPKATSMLTTPTGKSVLAVGSDHHLRKHPLTGGPFTEISFLDRTDEAAYHPAGRFIAAVGVQDGRYGIYLATNQGRDRRPLAEGETAKRIHSLSFTQDGEVLWFIAEHEHRTDLHFLGLASAGLGTLPTTGVPTSVVTSQFRSDLRAYQTSCDSFVVDAAVQRQPLSRMRPVGFLADGSLVGLSGCSGAGDVHVVGPDNVVGPALANGVEAVAIRQPLPPPGELPNSSPNAAPA